MKRVEIFTARQREQVRSEAASWLNEAQSTAPLEHDAAEKLLHSIYAAGVGHAPEIIWCQSPGQIAIIAFLASLIQYSYEKREAERWARKIFRSKFCQEAWTL